jgi:hypothetical protein
MKINKIAKQVGKTEHEKRNEAYWALRAQLDCIATNVKCGHLKHAQLLALEYAKHRNPPPSVQRWFEQIDTAVDAMEAAIAFAPDYLNPQS